MKKSLKPVWKTENADMPSLWKGWLLHAGSFMQHLAERGVHDAQIQVVRQSWQLPEPDERKLVGIPLGVSVLIREVLIVSPERHWMFARTVIPEHTLTGQERQLAHLKNRSLGSVLFKDPALQRSAFELTCLQPALEWHAKVMQAVQRPLPDLWARRSLFTLHGKPVLLTEVFLPDIATLCS